MTEAPAVPVSRAQARALVLVATTVILVLVARVAWVTEDAYITLRTVDNWVSGYGLRWNVDERVQGYTHPLWMFALAALYRLTHEAFFTTAALGFFTTAAALWLLGRSARTELHALVALAALGLSRSFIDFSTSGLENPLSHLLIALFVAAYAVHEARLLTLVLLGALLALNRMDTVLVVLPALAHAALVSARHDGLPATLRALVLGGLPYLGWALFSLFYYGALVPNTAYAKLNTGIPPGELLRQGLAYLYGTVAWDPPLVVGLVVGLGLGFSAPSPKQRLIALGALLYLVYVARVGGDFMWGRFMTVPLFTAATLLARAELGPLRLPTLVPLVSPLGLLWLHPAGTEEWPIADWPRTGIADERGYYRNVASVMMATRTSDMPVSPWAEQGRALARQGTTVSVAGNIGFLGFGAGPGVHIIDPFALTDPLLARLPLRPSADWRVGHYGRELPAGYLASVRDGMCAFDDADLCTYWRKLREITAGELWSWSRLRAVVELQLGHYNHLLEGQKLRRPAPVEETLERMTRPVAAAPRERGLREAADLARLRETLPDGASSVLRVLPPEGVGFSLGRVSHAASLSLEVTPRAGCEIEFRRRDRKIGTATLGAQPSARRTVEVPAEVREQGVDRLVLRPLGEGAHAAAGVLVMGAEPTSAALLPR